MITIENKIVFLGSKKIGKLINNVFRTHRSYERHLYRVLHSWCLTERIALIPNLKEVIFFISKRKWFSITTEKINSFMKEFNTYIKYSGYERQIAIPLSICDLYDNGKFLEGIDIEAFKKLVDDPHSQYKGWSYRKKAKSSYGG